MNLFSHYRKLVYFTFNRFKPGEYAKMSKYFAERTIREIEQFVPMQGARILDVGGGNGEFCEVFEQLRPGCDAINIDPGTNTAVPYWHKTILESAENIPFPDDTFDVVTCRGVIEHLPPPLKKRILREMGRVLKPTGVCYIITQPWWNPNAGHHLKPFHVLPFPLAKFLRRKIFGTEIKGNSYNEEHLFPATFRGMRRMIDQNGLRYVKGLDIHLGIHFMTKIPIVRELLVPAVGFVCRKR